MAIRIRKVKGRVVALCAAKSVAKQGDIYLDDAQHEALSNKFARDDTAFLERVGVHYKIAGCWDDSPLVESEECLAK